MSPAVSAKGPTVRRRCLIASPLILAAALSGCAGTEAKTAPAASVTSPVRQRIQISITNGTIKGPERMDMRVGQTVELQVTSDKAATVHAHGFNIEKDVAPGETVSLLLTASQPGSFDVEEHATGKLITRVLVTS